MIEQHDVAEACARLLESIPQPSPTLPSPVRAKRFGDLIERAACKIRAGEWKRFHVGMSAPDLDAENARLVRELRDERNAHDAALQSWKDERDAIGRVLSDNGCDCDCDCDADFLQTANEHECSASESDTLCVPCRIQAVMNHHAHMPAREALSAHRKDAAKRKP